MIKKILTIAGSDSSGGAGIQADLKTFSALGCYGMSVITALTAQNTRGVQGVYSVPADFIARQLRSIFDDITVDAVKIGMLGDADSVCAIADILEEFKPAPIVLDPVMVAQSGDPLIDQTIIAVIKEKLFPLATLITPNIPEAEILLGRDVDDPAQAARDLLSLDANAALLKGGHSADDPVLDVLAWGDDLEIFEAPRIHTGNTHGTGCTLSSAIACFLAQGMKLPEAVGAAKTYITEALRRADDLNIGTGAGPAHHFWDVWGSKDKS